MADTEYATMAYYYPCQCYTTYPSEWATAAGDWSCAVNPAYSAQSCKLRCAPPTRLNGQDVEIAIRKEPFKPYPKKIEPIRSQPKVSSRWPPVRFPTCEILDNEDEFVQKEIPEFKWSPRYCLRRIHALLTRPETEQMEDRLAKLWSAYERQQRLDVFLYEHVDILGNIVLLLSTGFKRLKFAQEMFYKIMLRLQKGIHVVSSKDLLDELKLAYFFTVLGLAIAKGHPQVQKTITNVLIKWLENAVRKGCGQKPPKKVDVTTASSLISGSIRLPARVPCHVLTSALEKSLLPRIVTKFLSEGPHTEAYTNMLSLLKFCCDVSPIIRERLWCLSVLDPVLLKLCMDDSSNRVLVKTIDFVFSYLGANTVIPEEAQKTISALEMEPFQVLLTRFFQQLGQCMPKSKMSTRNDAAFAICLIGQRIPKTGEYFQGDFGLLIASLIANGILGKQETEHLINSVSEGIELLQYLIYMLKSIVEAGGGEEMITDYNIVSALINLLLGPCSITEASIFEKRHDLDTAAWAALQAITKRFPLSMLTPHGVSSLLTFLKGFGEAGVGDQSILVMSLHTLRNLIMTGDTTTSEQVLCYFTHSDVMPIFLSVLKQLTNENFDVLQEPIISNALYCCGALGSYDLSQKEIFGRLEGVSVLTGLMRHLLHHSAEKRHMDPVIQIAVAECIWGCVAHYPPSLESFLASEGIFRMLDLLEIYAGATAATHLINCLLRLCDYPRCLDQLLFWQRAMRNVSKRAVFGDEIGRAARTLLEDNEKPASGDSVQELAAPKDKSLAALLCALWREEEKRFEVLRDLQGCIASLTHPLMSKFAREYDSKGQAEVFRSCLDDMSLSLRPKIFLLIKRLVERTRTEAVLFDDLGLTNQIVMQVIVNFVDLKESEIYLEMLDVDMKENDEGFSFQPCDDTAESKLAVLSLNKVAAVLETQRYLIRRCREKEETNEREFYALMKQCRLQDHLLAVKELDYLARTSNYAFLVERRLWQKSTLDRVAKELDESFTKNSVIHRTTNGVLNITTWCNRSRLFDFEPLPSLDEGAEYEENEIEEEAMQEVKEDEDDEEDEEEEEEEIEEGDEEEEGINSEGSASRKESGVSRGDLPPTKRATESAAANAVEGSPRSGIGENEEEMTAEGPEEDLEEGEDHEEEGEAYEEILPERSPPRAHFQDEVPPAPTTPDPEPVGGYYQVSPALLQNALQKWLDYKKKHDWMDLMREDDENYWMVRTKWKPEWYTEVDEAT